MAEPKKYDLEDRLVKFAILILEICDLLPNTEQPGTPVIKKRYSPRPYVW
jgi:hypothetical protein